MRIVKNKNQTKLEMDLNAEHLYSDAFEITND